MNPLLRIEHKAGDKMFIDYAGDKLYLSQPDGRRQGVEVFVAILGCSQLTYVEAVASQKKEDLIRATEHALHYFGGVPHAIVADNLKSAVTRASRYEAVLHEDFSSFAEHYGVTVYPARIYRPRDKALVENAVKLTYKDIYTKVEQLR
jgi:transposase